MLKPRNKGTWFNEIHSISSMFSSLVKRLAQRQIPVNISHGETFFQKKAPLKWLLCSQVWQRRGVPIPVFPLLRLQSGGGGLWPLLLRARSDQTYIQRIGNMQSTGVCRPASSNNCSPLKEDFGEINVSLYNGPRMWVHKNVVCDSGGTWYCFPDIGLNQPVPTGTKWVWKLFSSDRRIKFCLCQMYLAMSWSESVSPVRGWKVERPAGADKVSRTNRAILILTTVPVLRNDQNLRYQRWLFDYILEKV